jgi:hypothetical protein
MTSIHQKTREADAGSRARARGGAMSLAAMVAILGVVAACNSNDLLDVDTPATVPVSMIDDPKNAVLMVNSAVADFECAFGSMVAVEGIISDELADAQLGAAAWPYDRRDANTQPGGSYGVNPCTNNQTPGIYNPLSTARWDADHALENLNKWTDAEVPNRQALIAKAALYAGFSYAALGMSMCAAAFDLGPQVDQAGMFALAEERFTTAITTGQATNQPAIVNAAYVGRARVRLFRGNKTGAAADAGLVPVGFVLTAANDASDNRLYNRLYAVTQQFGFYTVESLSRDLKTENGELDPRSASKLTTTRPADARSPIYAPNKYSSQATPTRIASYQEAQLILAEAQGGSTAVTAINALRAVAGLQPYTGGTDAASIQALVIDERRRALFLEGFRNYDLQRFNLPFNPAVGTAYPLKGGTYGNTRCLPLPDNERFNNPNIT